MMNSTWLSRKIKGPNAEGDPVKKKNGKGVKPYQAIDMADYNRHQQMRNDSLSAHFAAQNIAKTIKSQSGGQWTSATGKSYDNRHRVGRRGSGTFHHVSKELGVSRGSNVDRALKSDNAADAISALFGGSGTKTKTTLVYENLKKGNPINNYTNYGDVKGIESSINELKRTDKSLGVSNKVKYYKKRKKRGENYYSDTSVTGYLTGDHDNSIISFDLPYRPKAKQEILLPITTKKKPTITKSVVKKKRPKDTISKMPIGKLKSKSTTPKKISNRKPSNFVSYDKPKKTSIANTGNPGSKTRYATVNRGDKRGTVYLTKSEYDKEMKNIFIK